MITTVTLNASIDKAYRMDSAIENGEVMRVASCRNSAGGKGLNVARIVKLCGEDVLATGFVGGHNGAYLEDLVGQDGIKHQFEHIQGETRSCINILDEKYGSTEYLEPGCEVTAEEEQKFIERFDTIIDESDVITISGSIPKGLNPDIYDRMVRQVKRKGKQVILDTSGKLLRFGIQACPTLIKPNQDEIEQLYDKQITNRNDVIACAKDLHAKGIAYVVISLGGDGALMVCDEGTFHAKSPKIEVVNTVGCGDSMVGALAVSLKRKESPRKALTYAVAVAAANALSPNTGDFKQQDFDNLIHQVEVNQL